MTPLVLELVTAVRRNPIPYLLAVATASNIGSVATITGNPQNIIIASLSQIPYGVFAGKMAPVAAIGLVITVLLIALVHRREFFTSERLEKVAMPTHHHGPLMAKTLIVMTVMIVLFFLGQPVAKVAIVGGAFLLFTRRVRPQKIYIEIDWPLLVMFVGLFVVVAGLEKMVLTPEVTAAAGHLRLDKRRARRYHGRTVEYREQRAGGPLAQAVRAQLGGCAARVADHRHGGDLRRQFHPRRLRRQSHRCSAGEGARRRDRLLGLF
jgi:Na+/H+ antiporter NhaD/arsenite permease-like protein